MVRTQIDKELRDYLEEVLKVCSSRAAYVINYILKNGAISSEDLRNKGYVHGARAIGDVRDNGVPLETSNIKSSDNRTIAQYTFGSSEDIQKHKFGGRIQFPKSLKTSLIERDGLVCAISNQSLPESELQVDHRVPYYISGDIKGRRDPEDFMLLSKSMQRTKSWDCEHCENLLTHFDLSICRSCYWAYPENYTHVAMRQQRSLNITWQDEEVAAYDRLIRSSDDAGCSPQDYVKRLVSDDGAE